MADMAELSTVSYSSNSRFLPKGHRFDEVRRIGSMGRGSILPTLNFVIPRLNDPLPKFDGFGIVTCAGGRYLRYLWAQVHKVREVSDAPIHCYHLGLKELEHPAVDLLRDMGVEFVDAIPLMRQENYQSLHGWCSKSVAVIHSPFQHVCFLDADAFAVIDPETILDHPDYEHGFLCFPDIQDCRDDNMLFPDLGLKFIPDFVEAEAGQFLIDKKKMWRVLQLYSFMNGRPKPFHDLCHGDKELLPLACMKLGVPFTMTPKAEWVGYGIKHYLSDGTHAFTHAMPEKRKGPVAPEIADLLQQFENIQLQTT